MTDKSKFRTNSPILFVLLQAYNSPETEYYNCAVQLEKFFYNKLRDHCLIDKAKD